MYSFLDDFANALDFCNKNVDKNSYKVWEIWTKQVIIILFLPFYGKYVEENYTLFFLCNCNIYRGTKKNIFYTNFTDCEIVKKHLRNSHITHFCIPRLDKIR